MYEYSVVKIIELARKYCHKFQCRTGNITELPILVCYLFRCGLNNIANKITMFFFFWHETCIAVWDQTQLVELNNSFGWDQFWCSSIDFLFVNVLSRAEALKIIFEFPTRRVSCFLFILKDWSNGIHVKIGRTSGLQKGMPSSFQKTVSGKNGCVLHVSKRWYDRWKIVLSNCSPILTKLL